VEPNIVYLNGVRDPSKPFDNASFKWDWDSGLFHNYLSGEDVTSPISQQDIDTHARILAATAEAESERLLLSQLSAGIEALKRAKNAAQGDVAVAEALKSQADALSSQLSTQRSQASAWTPVLSVAGLTSIKNQIVQILNTQKLIVDAMSAMYAYRKAVDENAVTTDEALIWLAKNTTKNYE